MPQTCRLVSNHLNHVLLFGCLFIGIRSLVFSICFDRSALLKASNIIPHVSTSILCLKRIDRKMVWYTVAAMRLIIKIIYDVAFLRLNLVQKVKGKKRERVQSSSPDVAKESKNDVRTNTVRCYRHSNGSFRVWTLSVYTHTALFARALSL